MLKITNYDKIRGKEFTTSKGVEWKIVKVSELNDWYDFIIRSETMPQVRIGIVRNVVIDAELTKPAYKVYRGGEFFGNYVTADWITDMDNVLELFEGLC